MLLIREKQFAEELRAMEIGVVCVYGVPREIVLLLRQIAAFVEIPPNRPGRNEFREKQPQQPEGELVCHVPAVRCPRTRCVQRRGSAGQKDPHPVLPARAEAKVETAVLVGLITQTQDERKTNEYLDELAFLAETAGAEVVKRFTQKLPTAHSVTYVGKGKLEEIRQYIRNEEEEER